MISVGEEWESVWEVFWFPYVVGMIKNMCEQALGNSLWAVSSLEEEYGKAMSETISYHLTC